MKFAIIADSSHQLGTGHLFRCLTLALQLKKFNHDILFIGRRLNGNCLSIVEKNGFKYSFLPNSNQDEDFDFISTLPDFVSKNSFDYIVIDNYAVDIRIEKLLRPYTKGIIIIDDLHNREHDCDYLLDHNLSGNPNRYNSLIPEHCKLLLGPKYSLLRDEFISLRKRTKPRRKLETILIFYGSSDPNNHTSKVLHHLTKNYSFKTINAILGPNNINKERISQSFSNFSEVKLFYCPKNIAELIKSSDLAFGSAGVSVWERCYLGLPSVLSILSENQKEGTLNLVKQRAAVCIDSCSDIDNSLSQFCSADFLEEYSKNCYEIIPEFVDHIHPLVRYLHG